ncbi:hypothetical protein DFH07DRAFT_1006913 [Mycena maculata]|uniref:ATPase AAA-type core domain-containing protein n=1 Tax=Mycena maculata TaxID=230809 RepID=A0AAD7HT93_9AGAR|nr:hypothetical protein DFH07DRAFT_999391 [Mycena maculata]KAJ7769153.1 hypothetical protein DFH07DRAFT_1006913 [Mycena maculata]
MQYSGIAALKVMGKLMRHSVKGRIMVDRATFHRLNANYAFPTPVAPKNNNNVIPNGSPFQQNNIAFDIHGQAVDIYGQPVMMQGQMPFGEGGLVRAQANATTETTDLSPEELLLTPTIVYGFSLGDKIWLEFDITKVAPVPWNEDAFANLVLPADRKTLLRSLVEAHHEEAGFDDFVKGKGAGLVVNLFGPPGVGKTFSAEATSEHVKRPLYVIGGSRTGGASTVRVRLSLPPFPHFDFDASTSRPESLARILCRWILIVFFVRTVPARIRDDGNNLFDVATF